VATGIDCEKRVDPIQNIISDTKSNTDVAYTPNNSDKNNNLSKPNSLDQEDSNLEDINVASAEVIEKVTEAKPESFIPPEPEFIEKEIIAPIEIKIDPFTEAEVLNASSNIQVNTEENEQAEKKETESLIKRFTGKSIFGNSNKNNSEINKNNEGSQNELDENIIEKQKEINNELSFSPEISMKSNENISKEDTLDIPAFLRRQRE